jgi:uncharacterized membrane protein YedE/YeeE
MSLSAAAVALAGGALLGVAAALLLLFNGRLAGVGGIVAGLLQRPTGEWGWRAAFVAGLLAGGAVLALVSPSAFGPSPASPGLLVLAGAAVGVGTRAGGGCTSGHGICGISRLSKRAMAATMTFMLAGAIVVAVVTVLGGLP